MTASRNIEKYLDKHAESDVRYAAACSHMIDTKYALVVPVFNESIELLDRFAAHPQAKNILLILVVNEPDTSRQHPQNTLFYNLLRANGAIEHIGEHTMLLKWQGLRCLTIDRTGSRALPEKQGVGLARKIGSDIAVALIHERRIQVPWIFSTDADATLPKLYFTAAELATSHDTSAVVYNFEHTGHPGPILEATKIYEQCIKYYCDALASARSPYAFHTLGSCFSISAEHYSMVRGFPKKSGAEDFYLLNKLAKVGKVHRAEDQVVQIQARLSDRVPFGTGPAVKRIMQQLDRDETIKYYDKAIFGQLEEVLDSLNLMWENYPALAAKLSLASKNALELAGLEDFVKKRKAQDKTLSQFNRSFTSWFDAFQTLKFVRRLEESHYPPVPIKELFEE